MLDWNDLRYVLVIARTQSVAEAASQLSVHQSTVFRRLNELEKALGVRLFDRLPTGYAATPAGEDICQVAERMEEDMAALDRRISGQDLRPSGVLRVTTTDALLFKLLSPCLALFCTTYPEIELEVLVSNQFFNLTKRDADVAIRPASNPPETLVGRRVSSIATAIYGSSGYLAASADLSDLSKHSWIGPDESLSHLASARWLKQSFPRIRMQYRSNTLIGMLEAAKQNLGLVALPYHLAEPDPDLQQVRSPLPELASELWLLTHEDLRNLVRVRVFIDFVASWLKPYADLLEGRRLIAEHE
ncbi:MAG: LysR family transcriptional regulator [Chroococcidiopsidaceae cyanobacterium CP_BM_RX_35]|nr:LysR family transcriptional regulator [Chroococcidiopsidaceae cyanobacterium CP_BM_RX_35]